MARAFSKFSWLGQYARPFPIPGRNVEVLYTPDKYYEAIKVGWSGDQLTCIQAHAVIMSFYVCTVIIQTGILTANQRVVLSSLYFGIGSRVAERVSAGLHPPPPPPKIYLIVVWVFVGECLSVSPV